MFKELFIESDTLKSLEAKKVSLMSKALKLIPGSPKQLKIKAEIKEIFAKIEALNEKVSPDCSTGPGVIPDGPWKEYEVIRTNHLDDPRNPPNPKQRDAGFDCDTFDAIITKLMQKRPLGLRGGKMQLTWKNPRGYQAVVVNIDTSKKTITFITVMQMDRKKATQYETKGAPSIDLGIIKEPN